MLRVINHKLLKTAALPPDIQIKLEPLEEQIFSFIRSSLAALPNPPTIRIAGGWVRDKLLGKKSKDYDITVEGMTGIEFATYLKQFAELTYGPQQRVIGTIKDTEARPEQIKNLAVAFLRIFGQDVEILNVRGEEKYEKGNRNPVYVNMQADPESDARRRDLTINALFYNINTGRLEDYTEEGYDDLLTMTLRTPLTKQDSQEQDTPEIRQMSALRRLSEDPLRALRVVRFYARYPNAKIAPELLWAMKDTGIQDDIVNRLQGGNMGIVPERTATELRKLMTSPVPERGVQLLYETGLLERLFNLPSHFQPLGMSQRNKHHELSVVQHIIQVIKNVNKLAIEFGLDDERRMMLNLAALFHDIGKLDPRSHKQKPSGEIGYSGDPTNPNAVAHEQSSSEIWEGFARALKLSDNERLTVQSLVAGHMNPHDHVENEGGIPTDKTLRRYLRKNPDWLMQYIHAMGDAMSKSDEPVANVTDPYRENMQRLRGLAPTVNSFGLTPPAKDLLNGNRIIELVGLPAKPPPGQKSYIEFVKERIREAQDENPNLSISDAEQLVLQMKANGEFEQYRQ